MDQLIRETIEQDFKKFFNNIGRRKEYIGDIVTMKVRELKSCSLDVNSSTYKFNMTSDPEYGIIKTIFKTVHDNSYKVSIGTARGFDTLFIIILNKGKRAIERVYAIPEKELEGKRVITVVDTGNMYQKFKIDEKPFNDIYCYMKTGKYSILEDRSIVINYTDR